VYDELMRQVYCFLAIGESDVSPEMSKKAFASAMRSSIARTILSHHEGVALQGLTDFGKAYGELWVEHQRAVQNRAEAEKSLEHAAKRAKDLQRELNSKRVGVLISPGFATRIYKKRNLEEVEGIIQDAADVHKRVKQEEKTP
jgi:hypothetical protein